MTAVLHTWGSDLKYHVHAHCLVTFGGLSGDAAPVWKWPRRKNKLAPFRKLCATFRCVMLSGLKQLLQSGQVSYQGDFAVLEAELERKRWVVNHQPPTADTKVIEEYLGRYISRIGISNKRFHYDVQSGQVRIEYNDYARQQPGQPAPKAYRTLPPLVAMHQLLQHQTPAHFQRVRHYGLHAASTRRKIGDQLPQAVKKEGQTVRTLIQILRALLGTEPFRCGQCGSTGFEVQPINSDRSYLDSHVLHRDRSPPFGQAGKTDHWINTSSRGGEPEPALSER
jgi:glutathione S-transferase